MFDRANPYNTLPSLPPPVELESREILKQTIASARALADLRGTSSQLPNPRVLVSGILLQEARLSSEVENIVTTSDELYRAAAGADGPTDAQTKEVLRYREALWMGFEQMGRRGIGTNLFVEIVRTLRQLDIDIRTGPGTTLKDQFGQVVYTPPAGDALLRDRLQNLEEYIHRDDGVDPLIKLAVIHYQFEAIHPFTDGNGRTGRIVNVLYLVDRGLLDLPVLYLSHYILKHRGDYYRGLRAVTEEHRWQEWIIFMLRGIEETSKETCALIQQILGLMEEATSRIKAEYPGIYSKDLMEVVFSNPYCRIRFIEEHTGVTRQTASIYLRKLTEAGILEEQKIGREVYYINRGMIEILASKR